MEPGTKKAKKSRQVTKGDGSQPTQGSSVKPAHEESEQDGEEISEEEVKPFQNPLQKMEWLLKSMT